MLIATYGSLRVGHFNHIRFLEAFGEAAFTYLKTTSLPGYSLYDFGPFPGAIKDPGGHITVDLFEVSDDLFNVLNHMETDSGYYLVGLGHEGKPVYTWLYGDKRYCNPENLVTSGDWSRHVEAQTW